MKQKRLLSMLALLLVAVMGAWAQEPTTYSVKMADATDAEAANWTIASGNASVKGNVAEGLTGIKEGDPLTLTYAGDLKVKSVRATVKVPAKTVDLSTLTGDYEAQDGDVLTGELSDNYKITIAAGATVTLDGVTIKGVGVIETGGVGGGNNDTPNWAGLNCEGNATIILAGTNSVKAYGQYYPAIHVKSGNTLTIQGDGSLEASPYNLNCSGGGIGGGSNIACGNIVIESGTITATGGYYAAAIGSGNGANCGNITIKNTVTKVTTYRGGGMEYCIGKGFGSNNSCGIITIGSESSDTGGAGYADTFVYPNDGGIIAD